MSVVAPISIDLRTVWRLVMGRLIAGVAGLNPPFKVYAQSEQWGESDHRFVKLVRMSLLPMGRNTGSSEPDVGNLVLAFTVGAREKMTAAPEAGSRADLAAHLTAASLVRSVISNVDLTDTDAVTVVRLHQAEVGDDGEPESPASFRTCGITVTGLVSRRSGTSIVTGGRTQRAEIGA